MLNPRPIHSGTSSERNAGDESCKNELQLLLRCLQVDFQSTIDVQPLDWECFVQMAEWHGVLSVVAERLRENQNVPANIIQRLRAAQFNTAARNLFLASQLEQLASSFDAERIPYIPWKGLVLSEELYD